MINDIISAILLGMVGVCMLKALLIFIDTVLSTK